MHVLRAGLRTLPVAANALGAVHMMRANRQDAPPPPSEPDLRYAAHGRAVEATDPVMSWLRHAVVSRMLPVALAEEVAAELADTVEPISENPDSTEVAGNIKFSVIADMPYNSGEKTKLDAFVRLANRSDSSFFVHLGDIKTGGGKCELHHYTFIADHFVDATKLPGSFVIIGDNEWNDCPDLNPKDALARWKGCILDAQERRETAGGGNINAHRSLPGEPTDRKKNEFRESFWFKRSGVLFFGLALPSSGDTPGYDWARSVRKNYELVQRILQREAHDVRAIVVFGHDGPSNSRDSSVSSRNKVFFQKLREYAQQQQKPMLYMYGDNHSWLEIKDYAPHIHVLRMDNAAYLSVEVTQDADDPFRFYDEKGRRKTNFPQG